MNKSNIIKAKLRKQKRILKYNKSIDRHRYLRVKIKEYYKKNILPITFAHFEIEGKKLKKLRSDCRHWRLKYVVKFFNKERIKK